MKKFLIFILIVGGLGAAGYFLYDPHLKPVLGPIVEKITGSVDGIGRDKDRLVENSDPKNNTPGNQPKKVDKPKGAKADNPAPKAKAKEEPKKVEPPKSEIDRIVEAKYPMPKILPLMQIVDNWNNVPAKAYPRAVAIKQPLKFTIMIDGQEMGSTLAPGTEVAPARIDGATLHVVSLSNPGSKNSLPIDATDFKERVTKRYDDFVAYQTKKIAATRAKAKTALEANADKVAALQANQGKWDQKGDPRFGPVKQSLASGSVSGVTLDEATSFRWNGSERVGGELAGSYDTVTVHFEVSTIFGNFPTDYKCLMNNGRVVGWIDPITDEKI